MRKLIQFLIQLGLAAVFSGFIGAILGGGVGLLMVMLGLARSGDVLWFAVGGAGVLAGSSLIVKGRSVFDKLDVDEDLLAPESWDDAAADNGRERRAEP